MEKRAGEVNPRPGSWRMSKEDPERARRLAEALRANLRRRKAQARATAVEEEGEKSGRPAETR